LEQESLAGGLEGLLRPGITIENAALREDHGFARIQPLRRAVTVVLNTRARNIAATEPNNVGLVGAEVGECATVCDREDQSAVHEISQTPRLLVARRETGRDQRALKLGPVWDRAEPATKHLVHKARGAVITRRCVPNAVALRDRFRVAEPSRLE